MHLFTRFMSPLLTLGVLLFCSGAIHGQNSVLLDDFNRADSPTVGNGWVETETTPGTGATVTAGQLRLSSGTVGKDFVSRDVRTRYSPVLSDNAGQLTWAWNMQQSRPNPSGFLNNNYGVAFVLAGSTENLLTGNGYAVVYGNGGASDSLRLVRYTGGLSGNTNLKTLVAVAVPANPTTGPFSTVRVTYSAEENTWTLEQTANTTSFDDPTTATFTRVGSRSDDTYTGVALPYIGCFWNHATTATEAAVFDNIYVTAPCTQDPEPTQAGTASGATGITSTSATLNWTTGNGSGRLVVVRGPGASTALPSDGVTYPVSASFGTGGQLGTGAYAVATGTASSVTVQGLQPNTTYTYQVYEYNGAGCATNYLQSPSQGPTVSVTFTTQPCQLATAPTASATAATATLSGTRGAVVSWQPGNGSGRLVVVRAGQAPTTLPVSGMVYSGGSSYGTGSALAPGEFVVYSGTGTTVTLSNLPTGQTLYVAVYEFNGTGCATAYRTTAPATAQLVVPTPPVGTPRFFFGNLHAHSAFSDGNQDAGSSGASTPLQDFQFADASLHSDFLGIAEHNHSQAGMQRPNYAIGLQQADQATNADFVALYGMEWGVISGGGHALVYGVNELLGWEPGNYDVYVPRSDYNALFRQINKRPGAFATLAHPQSGDYNNLATGAFRAVADSAVVGTVLRSGPATSTNVTYSNPSSSSYESTFTALLAKGYHVGITLDHDNHNTTFNRTTQGRLVIVAPSLTKEALLTALRQRSFYASDDWNAEVTYTVGGQPMGSIFTAPVAPAIALSVNDVDGEAIRSITLMKGTPGSGQVAQALTSVAGTTALTFSDAALATGSTAYYYAIILEQDGDRIVTSPIWYTRNVVTGTQAAQPSLALQVFPNPTTGNSTLSYYLSAAEPVTIDVLDAMGRTVTTLRQQVYEASGSHTLTVPSEQWQSGVYLIRVLQGSQVTYQRLLVTQ
ncbi:T9SS type A sorting domain-containing protein [Hymenobacter metallicola]|uniref:T9SS type A sorting domain-containing protein n=1 Tax=Hymenobacter metallicola TaxID=2563114 RepID=A0A4Z0PY98_9BACT|nr:T9SS type A sorting domain-containing protein [Hymenobacter metallicola]TGE22697.1 T9SS type A sorting domain-containing protein [Hymenobacter metallicola]